MLSGLWIATIAELVLIIPFGRRRGVLVGFAGRPEHRLS
jgi:hypothetical protein